MKELPLCREKPIFHEPVGALIKDKEQLTAVYPNSFDRLGSLKGEYTIKIDPSVAPVQQARRKVPIASIQENAFWHENEPRRVSDTGTRSFQEVLSELRATKIRNDLPSPAEILHGRSLITGTLVLGERFWGTGTNNEWLDCYITGIDKENRCYWVVFEDTGRRLRRTRSHLRPHGPDFPHI